MVDGYRQVYRYGGNIDLYIRRYRGEVDHIRRWSVSHYRNVGLGTLPCKGTGHKR